MNGTYFIDDDDIDLPDDEFYDILDEDLDFDDETFEDDDDLYDDTDQPGSLINPIELVRGFGKILSEKFRHVDVRKLDQSLSNVLDRLSAEEEFNFSKALSSVGKSSQQFLQSKAVSDIGRTVLPAAGSVIGTVYGGPVGTAIGGQLGQAASQALFKGPKAPGPVQSPAQAGSAPAAQLLNLTQNPAVLNALGSLAMGSMGAKSVDVGNTGQSVPVGSIMNMLAQLAKQASADADELYHDEAYSYEYLQDSDGEFIVDPANPEARAHAMYSALMREMI